MTTDILKFDLMFFTTVVLYNALFFWKLKIFFKNDEVK